MNVIMNMNIKMKLNIFINNILKFNLEQQNLELFCSL